MLKENLFFRFHLLTIKTEIEQTVDVNDIVQSSFKFALGLGDKTV